MEPVVSVRGLRYRDPDGTLALDGVDFDLEPGEPVAVLGGNGSGKTTFLLHLNGLLRGEGEIAICGLPVAKRNLETIRRKNGFVFQDADDQLFLPSVLEDVAYGLVNAGQDGPSATRAAEEVLRRLGMEKHLHKAPYHLSGGEKRRAALAGVLVLRPEILVLDEPTTSLDPPAQRELASLLCTLPQAKIIATHDPWFARAVTKRAVFFEKGRIVSSGPVDRVILENRWDPELAG